MEVHEDAAVERAREHPRSIRSRRLHIPRLRQRHRSIDDDHRIERSEARRERRTETHARHRQERRLAVRVSTRRRRHRHFAPAHRQSHIDARRSGAVLHRRERAVVLCRHDQRDGRRSHRRRTRCQSRRRRKRLDRVEADSVELGATRRRKRFLYMGHGAQRAQRRHVRRDDAIDTGITAHSAEQRWRVSIHCHGKRQRRTFDDDALLVLRDGRRIHGVGALRSQPHRSRA